MKTESMRLNALALANAKLAETRESAKAHVAQIKYARTEMERAGFTYPPSAGPAEVARLGAEYERKRTALRSREMNFDVVTYTLDLLDKDVLGSKALLQTALTFIEQRHRDYLKATKIGLLAKLSAALKPSPSAEVEPKRKREPVRGPLGYNEPPPIEIVLAGIANDIRRYPNGKSLPSILTAMNVLNGRLEPPETKPTQAAPYRKGYSIKEHRSLPQPHTPYTNPLPIDQPSPSLPMRCARIIGA